MRLLIDTSKRSADNRVSKDLHSYTVSQDEFYSALEAAPDHRPSRRARSFQLGWVFVEFDLRSPVLESRTEHNFAARLWHKIRHRRRVLELPSELLVQNSDGLCSKSKHIVWAEGSIQELPTESRLSELPSENPCSELPSEDPYSELPTSYNQKNLPCSPQMKPVGLDDGGLYCPGGRSLTSPALQGLSQDLVDVIVSSESYRSQDKWNDPPLERIPCHTLDPLVTPYSPPRLHIEAGSSAPPGMVSASQSLTPSPVSPATPTSTSAGYTITHQHSDVNPIKSNEPPQQTLSSPLSSPLGWFRENGAIVADKNAINPTSSYRYTRDVPDAPAFTGLDTIERAQQRQHAQGPTHALHYMENGLCRSDLEMPTTTNPEDSMSLMSLQHRYQSVYPPSGVVSSTRDSTPSTCLLQQPSMPAPSATHPNESWDHASKTSSWHRKLLCAPHMHGTDVAHQLSDMVGGPIYHHQSAPSTNSSQQQFALRQLDADTQSHTCARGNVSNGSFLLYEIDCSSNSSQRQVVPPHANPDIPIYEPHHLNQHHAAQSPVEICLHCEEKFHGKYRKGNCARHVRMKHMVTSTIDKVCRKCEKVYQRADAKRKHEWKKHRLWDSKPSKRRKPHTEI